MNFIWILIFTSYQYELIYLYEGESYIICNSDKYVEINDSDNKLINWVINEIDLIENNEILQNLSQIDLEQGILIIGQSIVTVNYFQTANSMKIKILYKLNEIDLFKFVEYEQQILGNYNNKVMLSSIQLNININLIINQTICYDNHLLEINKTIYQLLLICYSDTMNSYQLMRAIFEKQRQIVLESNLYKIDLPIQMNECSISLTQHKQDRYLIICLGTVKWALYKVIQSNNQIEIELYINNELLINSGYNEEQYIFSDYNFVDQDIQFYYDNSVVYVNLQSLQIRHDLSHYSQKFSQNVFYTQATKYHQRDSNKSDEFIPISTQHLKKVNINNVQLLYNSTHIIINNFIQNKNSDFFHFWEKYLISIIYNNTLTIFQINPNIIDFGLIKMNQDSINMTLSANSEKIQFQFKNLTSQSQYLQIHNLSNSIYHYGQSSILSEQIFTIPFYSNQIKTNIPNLQTNLGIEIEQFYLKFDSNPIIERKLIQFDWFDKYFIWLIKQETKLYFETHTMNSNITRTSSTMLHQYEIISELHNKNIQYIVQYYNFGTFIVQITLQRSGFPTYIQQYKFLSTGQIILSKEIEIKFNQQIQLFYLFDNKQYFQTNNNVYQLSQITQNFEEGFDCELNKVAILTNSIVCYKNHKLTVFQFRMKSIIHNELKQPQLDDSKCFILNLYKNQFLLIINSDNNVSFLHYYVTFNYYFILIKTITPSQFIIIHHPYKIQQAGYFFSIEAQDTELKEQILLLYDISVPEIISLHHVTVLLSSDYIITKQGHIIFNLETSVQIIDTNKLRITETITNFQNLDSINQLVEIKYNVGHYSVKDFNLITLISIIYYNLVKEIQILNDNLIINYLFYQRYYNIDLNRISIGIIEKVGCCFDKFQQTSHNSILIHPLQNLQRFQIEYKEVVLASSDLLAFAYRDNDLFKIEFALIPDTFSANNLNLTMLYTFQYNKTIIFKALKIMYIDNNRILVMITSYMNQIELYIYNITTHVIQDPYIISLNSEFSQIEAYKNQLIFIQNSTCGIYELRSYNNNQYQTNQIYIHQSELQYYADEYGFYGYSFSDYFISVQLFDFDQQKFKPLFKIEVPFLIQELIRVKLITLSKSIVRFLYQDLNQVVHYFSYLINNSKKSSQFKLSLAPISSFQIIEKAIQLDDVLLVKFLFLKQSEQYLYTLKQVENNDIIYPIQKINDFDFVSVQQIKDSIYLTQGTRYFNLIQIFSHYQLYINNPEQSEFDIILQNLYFSKTVHVIIKQPLKYFWIICTFGIILTLILRKKNGKQKFNYKNL